MGLAQGRGLPAISPGSKMVQLIPSEQHLHFCLSICIYFKYAVTFFFFDDPQLRSHEKYLTNETLELHCKAQIS